LALQRRAQSENGVIVSEFFAEYGMFLLKAATVVIAIGAVIIIAVSAGIRSRGMRHGGQLEIDNINDQLDEMRHALSCAVLDPAARKVADKAEQKRRKAEEKAQKKAAKAAQKAADKAGADGPAETDGGEHRRRVFVLDFDGDIQASATDKLRREVSAVLGQATAHDEVVLRLESAGGVVNGYGLAASQLTRLRGAGVPLTICVDKVAASGGYMMACVGDRVLAAPFAVLGSIGVVAQLPNVHKLLKKHDIDVEILTAGEYKRTLTVFGENTEKGRQKFIEDLEDIHSLFKQFVKQYRPQLDVDAVGTGEIWFGERALDKQLCDEIRTSDDYLLAASKEADVFALRYVEKKTLQEKLGVAAQQGVEGALLKLLERANRLRLHS
jgi:serine protease SohB